MIESLSSTNYKPSEKIEMPVSNPPPSFCRKYAFKILPKRLLPRNCTSLPIEKKTTILPLRSSELLSKIVPQNQPSPSQLISQKILNFDSSVLTGRDWARAAMESPLELFPRRIPQKPAPSPHSLLISQKILKLFEFNALNIETDCSSEDWDVIVKEIADFFLFYATDTLHYMPVYSRLLFDHCMENEEKIPSGQLYLIVVGCILIAAVQEDYSFDAANSQCYSAFLSMSVKILKKDVHSCKDRELIARNIQETIFIIMECLDHILPNEKEIADMTSLHQKLESDLYLS